MKFVWYSLATVLNQTGQLIIEIQLCNDMGALTSIQYRIMQNLIWLDRRWPVFLAQKLIASFKSWMGPYQLNISKRLLDWLDDFYHHTYHQLHCELLQLCSLQTHQSCRKLQNKYHGVCKHQGKDDDYADKKEDILAIDNDGREEENAKKKFKWKRRGERM